ncbi:MAG: heavy-metal-associated domain-containing protein [Bacteroidia bacterium]|nr:heavy-metal-associated domain-containing protein [Bacteroidia bacterium]
MNLSQTSHFLILTILVLGSCSAPKEASFFVQGSCQACAALIEEAVEEVSGADYIAWDTLTSQVIVEFRGEWNLLDTIQASVANAGFETQFYPANEAARGNLPACCTKTVSALEIPGGPDPHGH